MPPALRIEPLRHVRAALQAPSRRFGTMQVYRQENTNTIEAQALVISSFGEPKNVLRLQPHKIERANFNHSSVLLRTLAAPINPADVNVVQGTYGALPRFISAPFGPGVESVKQPAAVLGNEGVFEVMDTGLDVKPDEYAPGDWVIPIAPGYGTWRTHVLTTKADVTLWKIPSYLREKGLQPIQAATVAVNPLTALKLVENFGSRWDNDAQEEVRGLKEGDWLLQNGANSSVGRLVIQLAKMKGLKTMNLIRERDDKIETEKLRGDLQALGADVVVTEAQLGSSLSEKLKKASGGRGASLMLDCVGGRAASTFAKTLNPGAEVVTYGAMSKKGITPGAGAMIFRDIRFRGFWVSKWGERFPEKKKEALEALLNMIVDGKLKLAAPDMVPWSGKEMRLVTAVANTLTEFRKGKAVFEFPPQGELPPPVLLQDAARHVDIRAILSKPDGE